ncbi:MAG: PorP/SprF family type IX secretion system membrane protein [Bacteroidales bacterium]|nr:PorP/SprF family type IX secretion system membrane protein [Bacteroidales bacterium]MBN2818303.1 PorP/SprF family type IX secretion system membrane protein [Bacteroidales bacterium]
MKLKYIAFVVLGLFLLKTSKSQDSQFSQFYSSPLYLSPSLTGATEKTRFIANYRNQWPNLPKAYTDYAFSFDHYLYDYKSGIGAMIFRTQEGGVYNTTNLGLTYSYTIPVNREISIRPGMKAGYYFRNIDYNSIDFADQLTRSAVSSIEIPKEEMVKHYDFSTSALVYSSFYWFGFTGDHLLSLNKNFSDDPTYPALKISVYGGAQMNLFESVISKVDRTFTVSFFYKNQARFNQLDLGAYYEEHPFRIGLFFRGVPVFKDNAGMNAVVLLAGYTYRDILINYSYDISTSRLLASTGGAHEISLSYQFQLGWGGKSNKLGAVPCPHF